jgi:hypothetical protein
MLADRYLRWCVSGYGMASARFTALKTQVDRVRNMLTKYEGLVETVKGVQETLETEYTGYSLAVQCEVDDELHTAECVLRDVWTKEELQQALAEARRLLAETQAVDAPGAGAGAVQGSGQVATDDRPFKLMWSGWVRKDGTRRWVELRLYGAQIERWVDGKKDTVLDEAKARQLYPRMMTAEAARTGGGAQNLDMSQLLRRMQDVRE